MSPVSPPSLFVFHVPKSPHFTPRSAPARHKWGDTRHDSGVKDPIPPSVTSPTVPNPPQCPQAPPHCPQATNSPPEVSQSPMCPDFLQPLQILSQFIVQAVGQDLWGGRRTH